MLVTLLCFCIQYRKHLLIMIMLNLMLLLPKWIAFANLFYLYMLYLNDKKKIMDTQIDAEIDKLVFKCIPKQQDQPQVQQDRIMPAKEQLTIPIDFKLPQPASEDIKQEISTQMMSVKGNEHTLAIFLYDFTHTISELTAKKVNPYLIAYMSIQIDNFPCNIAGKKEDIILAYSDLIKQSSYIAELAQKCSTPSMRLILTFALCLIESVRGVEPIGSSSHNSKNTTIDW